MAVVSNSSGSIKPDMFSVRSTADEVAKLAGLPETSVVLTKGEPINTQAVNGDRFGDYGAKLIPVVKDAKSKALITRPDTGISIIKGKQVRLLYYRSGSGGPYGYPEGRVMTFAWDGQ